MRTLKLSAELTHDKKSVQQLTARQRVVVLLLMAVVEVGGRRPRGNKKSVGPW